MRTIAITVVLILGVSAVLVPAFQQRTEATNQAAPAGSVQQDKAGKQSADEAAIRANIEAFAKAYNAGDSKAVAALFTPDGQIMDKEGNETEGREEIAKVFADAFKEMPNKRLEVSVDLIRFIGSDLAVEVGTTKETPFPNEPPAYDRYTVLHVKRDGKWQMALAREEEGPHPTAHERLKPLAWLVGEWVDDGGSAVTHSTCRWSEDGNYLMHEFRVKLSGHDAMNVSQRIGWDPAAKCIRAWVFDSEGGFGESRWTRDGNDWIIKATGVRPDGMTASATNYLQPIGTDGYVWRSSDRIVGDETQPTTEIKVARKPPQPKN